MKFDVVIGNPPYQTEMEDTRDKPIYHLFMDESFKIANKVCLITPARFLFNVGATPVSWNEKMKEDIHLKVVFYETDSSKVFTNTDIKGGVSITYRDSLRKIGPIGDFSGIKELNYILEKVNSKSQKSINLMLYGVSNYKFTDKIYEDFPQFLDRIPNSRKRLVGSNIFDKFNEAFSDNEIQDNQIKILGREKNKRVYKWINRDYIEQNDNLEKFKVIIPASNGSGAIGEVLSTPLIGEPLIGHTQTFISIGAFEGITEAENSLKYIKSKFARVMLGTLKVTQHNQTKDVWKNVPLQDFTSTSDIDWTQSISDVDKQLYKKYGLTQEEIDFIETKVKEME